MVRPESALRRLMRDTGKLLQPYGFEGSEPAWVRVEPDGVASVGRTRVHRTWTDGQQELRFGLTLNATPTAWWEFCNWRNARLALPRTPLERATGPGLLTDAELPHALTESWSLPMDSAQPGHVVQDAVDAIRAELPRRVHAYARRALRLLEPGAYLDELLALPDPKLATWEVITVLLADDGPGPRLDTAFDRLLACCTASGSPDYARDVIAYSRSRAALV